MRIRTKTALRVGLITLALSTSAIAPAAAATNPAPIPDDDSSGVQPVYTASQLTQIKDKNALAAEYYAEKTGGGTPGKYASMFSAYKQRWGAAGPRSGSPAATAMTSSTSSSSSMTPMAAYTQNHLSGYYQVAESPGYYCGPASGYSNMNYMGFWTSNDGYNVSLSQSALAGSRYMQTAANGTTTWGSNDWASGSNNWAGGGGYLPTGAYYEQHDPGSTMVTDLTTDIDAGQPFGADTVEVYRGPHYNGHPDRQTSIGHWLGVFGYDNSGANTEFADSSTSIFPNAQRYFNTVNEPTAPSTTAFANTYLSTNGIAY
ncbi:MAG TPA: C39 family peptidase [Sporichthyaceae bacterium]|jgi:hypothetical protein|nr:C39 family peptidase [Sporichthyaceae bacterium]